MQNQEIQLHDIKPLLEIQEYSLYYFIVLVSVSIILLLGISYLLYKYFKNKKKFNIRKEHLKSLHEISFDDAKKAAYEITFYGATFKDDSQRHAKAYEHLLEHLEAFKYKKDVGAFSDDAKHYFEVYLGLIDV